MVERYPDTVERLAGI